MNLFSWIGAGLASLFGSSKNGKGVIEQTSDLVDKWAPSEATQHKMDIEDQKAGDESQANAYTYVPAPSHDSWFDILVDGLNRMVRPFITYWVCGVLFGWWEAPQTQTIDPLILNVVWTVITFWFGSRVIVKDIPALVKVFRSLKK